MTVDPTEGAAFLNATRDGWSSAMNIHYVRASRDEVVATIDIGPAHHQGYGIVHGGVHAGFIETLASVGAALDAMSDGRSVVGLENHTSFVRAVRAGKLTCTARPITRGRRAPHGGATVVGDDGKIAAKGTVRLLCLEAGSALAGEPAGPKTG